MNNYKPISTVQSNNSLKYKEKLQKAYAPDVVTKKRQSIGVIDDIRLDKIFENKSKIVASQIETSRFNTGRNLETFRPTDLILSPSINHRLYEDTDRSS